MSVQYITFLKAAVVNSVSFGKDQVAAFDSAFDPTYLFEGGTARESTEGEIEAYLEDQVELATPHGRLGSIPAGGDDGQILAKRSNNDFDAEWVDNEGGGSSVDTTHAAVRAATTEPLTACTYDNGADGVGATLTCDSNELLLVDNESILPSDAAHSVLIIEENNARHNGIYDVTDEGGGDRPWVLTRREDFDEPGEMQSGSAVFVKGGVTHFERVFILSSPDVEEVGDTELFFAPVSSGLEAADSTEVDTGTDDAKYITPSALEGSTYVKESELPAPGGQVDSVAAGSGIAVDETDPENPVVSSLTAPIMVQAVDKLGQLDSDGMVYDNGVSGVGATLTATTPSTSPVVDDYTLQIGDKVLIMEGTPTTFGVYERVANDGSDNWVLERVSEMDESGEFIAGRLIIALQGQLSGHAFTYKGDVPSPVIGTDDLQFIELNAVGILPQEYAFADLPPSGMFAIVNDSTETAWGRVPDGGGANRVLAWFDGSSWSIIGTPGT